MTSHVGVQEDELWRVVSVEYVWWSPLFRNPIQAFNIELRCLCYHSSLDYTKSVFSTSVGLYQEEIGDFDVFSIKVLSSARHCHNGVVIYHVAVSFGVAAYLRAWLSRLVLFLPRGSDCWWIRKSETTQCLVWSFHWLFELLTLATQVNLVIIWRFLFD